MSDLAAILTRRIAATGPISIAEFMSECLLNPQHGYYTTQRPFGAEGDFVTAPEVSQMFGELIGLALAQAWMDQGAPKRFTLAELGPGRGTLMADLLRATRGVPGFHQAAKVHLVEASPKLRDAQRAALPGFDITFADTANDLPDDAPLLLVANEFFDALPIRQFIREGGGWRERVVGLTGETLAFGLSAPAPLADLAHRLDDTRDGDLVEVCPTAPTIIRAITDRIAAHGGAALIIDYGDWRSLGDTLQALRAHKPQDPLDSPGMADLTAHVDFEALTRATAPGVRFSRLTPQGVFLERLGITPRAQSLARGLSGAALDSHVAAHRRLTHPQEMGTLFKTLAFYPESASVPPGLES